MRMGDEGRGRKDRGRSWKKGLKEGGNEKVRRKKERGKEEKEGKTISCRLAKFNLS